MSPDHTTSPSTCMDLLRQLAHAKSDEQAVESGPALPSQSRGLMLFDGVCALFCACGAIVTSASSSSSASSSASSSSSSSSPVAPAAAARWVLLDSMDFSSNVESVEWVDDSSFYVSVREDNYLHHVSMAAAAPAAGAGAGGAHGSGHGTTMKEVAKINVNESGDDHVSFNVLDMALCPSANAAHNAILLATDKHRVILMQTGTSHQIRNFYNIVNDGYRSERENNTYTQSEANNNPRRMMISSSSHPVSLCVALLRCCCVVNVVLRCSTPRLAWSPCGKYAYVTSQDKCVAVLDIASGQTAHRIEGHQINVRDVAMNPTTNKLVTCSFDKTCRVWTPAVE